MKRNDLVARSLTLGLAVATAAASMSTPGGLMAPVTVQAETSNGTAETPAVSFSDSTKTAVGDTLTVKLQTENAGAVYTWYAVDGNTETAENAENDVEPITEQTGASLTIAKAYVGKKILVVVKESGEENAAEIGRALSDVITYAALPEAAVVKFGDAKMSECTTKLYKDAVSVTAQTQETDGVAYNIADSVDGLTESATTTYSFAKGDNEDGAVIKTLYFKTADGDDVYQQDITVNFDTTEPAISAALVSDVTKNSAKVTVTATDASTDSGKKLTYKLQNKAGTSPADNDTGVFDLSGLNPNTTYNYTLTVTDEAGNVATYSSDITITTDKTAMAGTASIKTDDDEEISTLTIGDIVKAVYAGADTSSLSYQWYRVPVTAGGDGEAQEITGQTEATYTLTTEDKNCKIKVVISDKDGNLSGSKDATTTAKVGLKTGKALSFGEDCYDADAKTLKVTVGSGTQASELQYSTDAGSSWTDGGTALKVDGETATLTLDNKSYTANSIQIRFKETADTAAGTAAIYDKAITATLDVEVSITGDLKYNEQITASVTGTHASENLSYQWFRANSAEEAGTPIANAANSTYTLTADDIGKYIKVKVTASNYEGEKIATTATTIAKADKRVVAAISTETIGKAQDLSTKTYTYTLALLEGTGAKYAVVAGDYASYDAYKEANNNTDLAASEWKDSSSFVNLTPNGQYTFFATYDQADARYEQSDIQAASVTIDKLKRPELKLNVTVEPDGKGKKVTITSVEDALYSFDGETYDASNTKSFSSSECTSITVGIKYVTDPLFEDKAAVTDTVDLTLATQKAPTGGELGYAVNATKTMHTISVDEEPNKAEDETLEYSLDGYTFGAKNSIQSTEFDAGAMVTVYVRKAASSGKLASPAAELKIQLPAASAAPSIGGSASFKESTSVTITAGSNATIYYTIDGSDPTITSSVYSNAIAVSEDTTIKAIAVEEGKIVSAVASKTFTKDTSTVQPVNPPTNNNTWTGPSTTTPSTDNKKDDNKTEDKATTTTETETKADGTQVTTTETKAEDGSVTAKVELKNDTTGVEATVKVAKDADGKVTDATAAVTQTSADKKAGLSAATVAQITEAAGTKAVEIKAEIVDESGNTVCRLTANAEDLKAGNKLKVLKYDSKTGDYVLVNKTTYKVDKDGNLAMNDLKRASYMVVTANEAETFSKQVLKTVKVETAKKNVTAGKKTKITLDDGLNMANVAKITYKTSRKSVATVNKNGTITTKKAGTVTIRATVTLKNGKTKSVKMTLTVKKAK